MPSYGRETEAKIREIVETSERSGRTSVIALAGVPGTGKSMLALAAAQRVASQPEMVREIQFHPSYSYEEFVEGLRIDDKGGVAPKQGVFLEWNRQALEDDANTYVLLIEELTRANLSAVLGELMTYIEHRDRSFRTLYNRETAVTVADNLRILATYNPTDRSAIEVDAALLRRLRVIQCPPSEAQLGEMLDKKLDANVIDALKGVFTACENKFPEEYEHLMPFGHGVFAEVENEHPDLHRLWEERLRHFLRRPLVEPHKFTKVIEDNYPWRNAAHRTAQSVAPTGSGGHAPALMASGDAASVAETASGAEPSTASV